MVAVGQHMLHHRLNVVYIVQAAIFSLSILILLTGRPNRARLRIGSAFGAAWALLFLSQMVLGF
jgi:hypothetical protein